MTKTIRHQLIDEMQERLENYSWSDIDPQVFAGRTIFDPTSDPLPVITVVAGLEDSERTRYGSDRRTIPMDISALVSLEDGADVTEVAEPIFGELHKAVFNGGELALTFGEGVDERIDYFPIEYRRGGIVDYPGAPGPAIITIVVSVAVSLETVTGDPYN